MGGGGWREEKVRGKWVRGGGGDADGSGSRR